MPTAFTLGPSLASAADLVARYDRPGPRYTSYPPVPVWTTGYGDPDFGRALRTTGADDSFALYFHFPFCAARCHYCGCNAVVTSQETIVDNYLGRLEGQLDRLARLLGSRRTVTQMHWGGGTPNLLSPAQMERVMALVHTHFALQPDAEVSVEADPRLATRQQIQHLRALGVQRISFGVQDLDAEVQRAIGRVQPATVVRQVVEWSREVGFGSVNVDLVYGLPGQTVDSVHRTLDTVLRVLQPDRIASFGYAHVPWAHPQQRQINEADLPGRDARFQLLAAVITRAMEAGYQWLGLDHFARPEDELAVAQRAGQLHRNFMGYTTMPAMHLLAAGMSGISDVAGQYAQSAATLSEWSRAMTAEGLGIVRGHVLTADDLARRTAIMRLLCDLSLPLTDIPGDGGATRERLAPLQADGLVVLDGPRLQVTDVGRFFLRNICMALDAHLQADGPARYSRTV